MGGGRGKGKGGGSNRFWERTLGLEFMVSGKALSYSRILSFKVYSSFFGAPLKGSIRVP